jgi:hypothetical protein
MKYGLRCGNLIKQQIELIAYYKWLNGSNDAVANWIEAEYEVLTSRGEVK